MKNLKKLLKRNLKIKKFWPIAMSITAMAGFFDASYLAYKHYSGTPLVCGPLGGCDRVLGSSYSEIFGIPLSLLGMIYYLFIFIITVLSLVEEDTIYLFVSSWFTVCGLIASAYFVYLQLIVIKEICLYCMFSALTSTVLFIFGTILLLKYFYGSSPKEETLPR